MRRPHTAVMPGGYTHPAQDQRQDHPTTAGPLRDQHNHGKGISKHTADLMQSHGLLKYIYQSINLQKCMSMMSATRS